MHKFIRNLILIYQIAIISCHATTSDDNDNNFKSLIFKRQTSNSFDNSEIPPEHDSHYNGKSDSFYSKIKVDNRKPLFRNCKSYAPFVEEEQPVRTFVIQVEAMDEDDDTIEYSFVSTQSRERPKFKIDKHTGRIETVHIFDRDEPIREKEEFLTVRATDNGRPKLDDVCTFKVTIKDVNDNAPVFDKAKYDETISQDLTVNSIVTRISASDLDDGNNSIVNYEILPDHDYLHFRIDKDNGVIYLTKPVDKRAGQAYLINVRAYNIVPDSPQEVRTEVAIRVIESNKKPPTFIDPPMEPIYLKEDFKNFSAHIVELHAQSNIPDKPEIIFELVTGRTDQTNNKKTFVSSQNGNSAIITLGKMLDYELITEYTLTMSVKNNYDLIAEHQIKIKVEDVNDNIPYFTEVQSGTILENEPVGTPVMQVRAFDSDSTEANNKVTFRLLDHISEFEINELTGNITALVSFDRENKPFYNIKVEAYDNSPSSLYNTGQVNMAQQVFQIEIGDKNDHPPKFEKKEYYPAPIREDVNINTVVTEVTAKDTDDESLISYTIVSGNLYNAFRIENSTGKIRVNNKLDYENTTEYTLSINAFDGLYDDNTTVVIKIENVNDVAPIFADVDYKIEIDEERLYDECIFTVKAYDGDIPDKSADQFIKYSIVDKAQQRLLGIDNEGCIRLKAPLNRDPPDGFKIWQVIISADDEDGAGLGSVQTLSIELKDINDNAPFLINKMPIVWDENKQPGTIAELFAKDVDEEKNGPPFHFSIDVDASEDIKSKFSVRDGYISALVQFDREEQKQYFIPILISDSGEPQQSNVSILHLVIGDENDNEMKEGSSSIFVYNYEGKAPDTEIGRVYVEDPDDWDLPDKTFSWLNGNSNDHFDLDDATGMITMLEGTRNGVYYLEFTVVESSNRIPRHSVTASVNVTVREIPEEAVDKSGSIRFVGITAEEFVSEQRINDVVFPSPKDKLRDSIAKLFNISSDNVDIFTVLKYNSNSSILDVRYSAHGSPYYEPERLNGRIGQAQQEIEKDLNLLMLMINIDECLIEKVNCESSCVNTLHKSSTPLSVFTNTTSFVGVNAFIRAECVCVEPRNDLQCLNGGTQYNNVCECPDGFEGPHCEIISIGFTGSGYAYYPPVSPCETTRISLELTPAREYGLVMYIGPLEYNPRLPVQDFLALELVMGYPVLTVDYGTGSIRIEHKHIKLELSKPYIIDIILQRTSIEMTVNNCKLSTCMSLGAPQGANEFLNVNAPLQLGGASVDLKNLAAKFGWTHVPQEQGYHGCIRNLTIDGRTYNIGEPSLEHHAVRNCQNAIAVAVSFGIDTNFLIAILVCIAVLLILLLAVVVHRRHQDGWHEKDMDDIRENIINYEDEGGGERDTDYDLNVLRAPPMYEDKPYKNDMLQRNNNMGLMGPNGEVPNIEAFLTDKKDACDKDTDAYPIDDVRHYAYEGDGNSSGSLSSLASCTDEGDLKFNYLSSFGPRFRKLADMYGEEPSDTDSNVDDDEGWRI